MFSYNVNFFLSRYQPSVILKRVTSHVFSYEIPGLKCWKGLGWDIGGQTLSSKMARAMSIMLAKTGDLFNDFQWDKSRHTIFYSKITIKTKQQ